MKYIRVVTIRVGIMQTNCYVLWEESSRNAVIMDPGDDAECIIDHVTRNELIVVAVIATHGHFDHILSAGILTAIYSVPFLIDKKDMFLLDRMNASATHYLGYTVVDPPPDRKIISNLSGTIRIGDSILHVIPSPGHTPGGINVYYEDQHLIFVGDTVFAGGLLGRTDHRYSSALDLDSSVKKILSLPGDTRVFPGHGDETTVARLLLNFHEKGLYL